MLEPEILKPYLLDDDPWVRGAVAMYFGEARLQDEELVPLILDACDRFGYWENVSSLAYCDRLPLTPATFERVLQLLAEATHANTAMHLSSIVAVAPVDLLHTHKTAILGNEHLLEKYRRSIQHRLELMSWSEERLWQEIQDLASRYEASGGSSNGDFVYDDAVIDALTPHDVPDVGTICRILADPETMGSWLESFLIDLAGARRLREAVPALVDMLRRDDATLPENCPEALSRIGHPDIVRSLRSCYATESWSFRDSCAGLLGEITHPESEEAMLAFLDQEDDIDIRTELCHGLCRLFSERGVEVVRRQIRDGYQEWMVSLEESLLPVIHVLGIELPEAAQWRKEREEQEHYRLKQRRELDEMGATYAALKEQGIDPFAKLDSEREPSGATGTTYRRHDEKVGRNDSCPCGSGKKYKKCCEGK